MGELREVFNELKELKKERHSKWKGMNLDVIEDSGVEYKKASDECYCFRSNNCKADFYPSTGRWRDLKTGKTLSGGAVSFLNWYKKRSK